MGRLDLILLGLIIAATIYKILTIPDMDLWNDSLTERSYFYGEKPRAETGN